jgi:hypothetical protein
MWSGAFSWARLVGGLLIYVCVCDSFSSRKGKFLLRSDSVVLVIVLHFGDLVELRCQIFSV